MLGVFRDSCLSYEWSIRQVNGAQTAKYNLLRVKDGVNDVDGIWFGWLEIVLGGVGLGLGIARLTNRSSAVIALGLIIVGVAHMVPKHIDPMLSDVGGLILLFGLGMTLSALRRRKKPKGN